MQEISTYKKRHALRMAVYGHLGVGSIHIRPFIDMTKDLSQLDRISKDIFKILKKYHGTLIGEHNAGRSHSRYLPMESKAMYAYMKKVKEIFDPKNILNPKVLFRLEPMLKHIKV
jgi:FAD/FMN-containing dehydrogenase